MICFRVCRLKFPGETVYLWAGPERRRKMQLSVLRPGLSSPRPFYQFMCQTDQGRSLAGVPIPGVRGAKDSAICESRGIGLF